VAAVTLAASGLIATGALASDSPSGPATRTPIKHLVVIFQENVSFDHYFATYPQAQPAAGDQPFRAREGTPSVNGLNDTLLGTANPNSVAPFLLTRAQANTCDQDHDYKPEQRAFDHGLMDKFVEFTGNQTGGRANCDWGHGKGLVMGYYDGGTVTGLWNYAQHFAMSDNNYQTGFGPSTVGALNLISGQTHGAVGPAVAGEETQGTVIGDPQPTGDVCTTRDNVAMTGRNIGDLLNARGVSWGFFEGGFHTADGKPACKQTHIGSNGKPKVDYIPHHQPFQYYASTANPKHLPPSSLALIGKQGDQANHQYDLTDFWAATAAHNLPAVSYLKAPGYQDGHADYSDPLLEQRFLAETINRLQRTPEWKDTAVVIAYDDSDGWYDHQMSPIVNDSQDAANDALTGTGQCGTRPPAGGYQGRCGYGPRLPLLVISPFAKANSVDHSVTDQASILRFIEDNWQTGRIGDSSLDARAGTLANLFDFGGDERRGKLFLDPASGQPAGEDATAESARRRR
jgi:phospholipase C